MSKEDTINKILDSLTWEKIGSSEDTLSKILTDAGIIHAEPIDYPLTDGIWLHLLDREGKYRILDISVDERLIYTPDTFNSIPLVVSVSSPISAAEHQSWFT